MTRLDTTALYTVGEIKFLKKHKGIIDRNETNVPRWLAVLLHAYNGNKVFE